ncbi:MAG: hypothetical protein JWS12_441 [Candidatus Saccharibacteria bacterium]|nr:hypothetical protein [Candidatus Saccharibacteria bacterium]
MSPQALPKPGEAVSWTASEYVANQKSGSWYGTLAIGAVAVAALIYLLTHDWISSAVVIILAAAFGIIGARQPRVLHYSVDHDGVHIENKSYPYGILKSFSVIDEGAINSIMLLPLKRFSPSVSIYYAPDDEDKILEVLSNYLPFEERARDPLDRLMHKVKF